MTPEQMKVTCVALRSDKYKQAHNWIGDYYNNHLCCIGVAAKVNGSSFFTDTGAAINFLEMSSEQKTAMIEWNDLYKMSFLQIADKMEISPLFLGGQV